MQKSLVEMAKEIVQAQCAVKSMTTEEIALALQSTFNALQALTLAEAKGTAVETAGETVAAPPVDPAKSIQRHKIVCLECGQEFKMLSPKHLRSHGLTGKEYRKKWGFSMRQPLCAKVLSERRKQAGKKRGLPDNLRKAIEARKKGAAKKK